MPLIDFGQLNLPIEEKKNYKKFISEFPVAVVTKLRLGIVLNFGGPVSHEFAIFAKFFCIDLLNALHLSLFLSTI